MKHIVTENSDPKPVVDINELIDTVREKKDCHLSIFITDTATSINIYPNDPDPHWIEVDGGYLCSECGEFTQLITMHCHCCGERLKHTNLERYKKENEEKERESKNDQT